MRYREDEMLAAKWRVADFFRRCRRIPAWTWWEWLYFRPIEAVNCIWLIYICAAQTVGAYETVSTYLSITRTQLEKHITGLVNQEKSLHPVPLPSILFQR